MQRLHVRDRDPLRLRRPHAQRAPSTVLLVPACRGAVHCCHASAAAVRALTLSLRRKQDRSYAAARSAAGDPCRWQGAPARMIGRAPARWWWACRAPLTVPCGSHALVRRKACLTAGRRAAALWWQGRCAHCGRANSHRHLRVYPRTLPWRPARARRLARHTHCVNISTLVAVLSVGAAIVSLHA